MTASYQVFSEKKQTRFSHDCNCRLPQKSNLEDKGMETRTKEQRTYKRCWKKESSVYLYGNHLFSLMLLLEHHCLPLLHFKGSACCTSAGLNYTISHGGEWTAGLQSFRHSAVFRQRGKPGHEQSARGRDVSTRSSTAVKLGADWKLNRQF